jgi:hypothetical protein
MGFSLEASIAPDSTQDLQGVGVIEVSDLPAKLSGFIPQSGG